jgi:hypothetical protein
MKRIFLYIEPIWLGSKNQISIRRVLAIIFSIDMVTNINYTIRNWEVGKSLADAAMLVGIEAGLITALLALTTYTSAINQSEHVRNKRITDENLG